MFAHRSATSRSLVALCFCLSVVFPTSAQFVDTEPILTFSGHTGAVNSVAFSPDGKWVLTGSSDGTAKLWDAKSGALIGTSRVHTAAVNSVAFSPDGKRIITGSSDNTAKMLDAETGMEIRTFRSHTDRVTCVVFSPDGSKILSGSFDSRAKLWDAETGEQIRTFDHGQGYVHSIAFSPDGRYLLTAGGLHVSLFDVESSLTIRTFSGHAASVYSVAFSPGRGQILTGSEDGKAKLWDVKSGVEMRTLTGHSAPVNSVAFSPEGNRVLTGSSDGTAKLWDAKSGALIGTSRVHAAAVNSVAFSPDGKCMLTGSNDETAKLWWISSVYGTVTDLSTGAAVANPVVATSAGRSPQSSTGRYSLTYLSPGVYDITVSKTGYQTIMIPNVVIREGQITELNIELPTTGFLNITTRSLAPAETGVEYNSRVRVGGGIYPYKYSIAYGELPPGLVLDTSLGNISGLPTATGSYTFAIGVTDSQSAYAEQEFTIEVTGPLTIITDSTLPRGTTGANYFLTLDVSGGTSPYTFAVRAGPLSPMFTLTSSGSLSGTPPRPESGYFIVQVTDASGRTTEKQFNLTIVDPVAITTSKLNDGIVGRVYNQTLAASGGFGAYRWEVYSGILPTGLLLDSQSGVLSGTPLEETFGSIVFSVSDQDGRVTFKDFRLQISEPLQILTLALPDGLRDAEYSEAIRVRGGIEPFTFSFEGQLPDGLSLNRSTGIVSGIPTTSQFRNFSVTVTDSSYPTTQSFTQILSLRVTSRLTIISPAVLQNEKKGVLVNPVVLVAKGGPSPYRWAHSGGFLPTGIKLDAETGELSGTPESKGDYIFTVQVTDATGNTNQKELFWHISDNLTITTPVVPDAAKDKNYNFALETKGGIPPYTWRVKSGTLPSGLNFNNNGTISGTPTQRQTYAFTIEVNDSDSPAQIAQQTYIIEVLDTLLISTKALPNARVNEAYTATVRAELGKPPYSWRLESGILPPGMQLVPSPTVAKIEGTPTEPGTYTFTLEISDTGTPVQTRIREFTIKVYGKVTIETAVLKSALVGVAYSENIIATGGELPYYWQIVQGRLPEGLRLNPSTGHISGLTTLTVGQSSEFTVRVTDSGDPSGFDEKEYVILVIEGVEITTFTIQKALQHSFYEATLEGQGGISPYHWSLAAGRLPNGMKLDPDTGIISGTPEESGVFDFTVQMRDSSEPPKTTIKTLALEVAASYGGPTPMPTPTATPISEDLLLLNMGVFPVEGFDPPTGFDYGAVPSDNSFPGATDGKGMLVSLDRGQGGLCIENAPIPVEKGLVELSVSVRATTNKVQLALVAFASPVDGSLGYVNPVNTEVPVNKWGQMRLVYDSPTEAIIPGLQFVLPQDAPVSSGTVYLDNLNIKPCLIDMTIPVEMQVDGSFDAITPMLLGLNKNSFLPTGEIPGTVSLADGIRGQGVRLELAPQQLAAHVALFSIAPKMPVMLHGSVQVKRESGDDGTLAFVITDGDQSLGYFLKTGHLPLGEWKQIQLAGNFEVGGKQIPPVAVVQLGGPNTTGSVVIDDLELDTVQGQTIIILLNLPEGTRPLEMVLIPAGTFVMGSPESGDEGPQHEVTITRPFYVGKYEVTRAQWHAVMGGNPVDHPNCPVAVVSWNDCQKFIQKLNETWGGGGRLPTEAEWECACRAGTTTRFYWGDDADYTQMGNYAWYSDNSNGRTHDVGEKMPNAWDLHDMSGNVWEWCQDWYGGYESNPEIDPVGQPSGSSRVVRGGGWGSVPVYCRCAGRAAQSPGSPSDDIGFRLAASCTR